MSCPTTIINTLFAHEMSKYGAALIANISVEPVKFCQNKEHKSCCTLWHTELLNQLLVSLTLYLLEKLPPALFRQFRNSLQNCTTQLWEESQFRHRHNYFIEKPHRRSFINNLCFYDNHTYWKLQDHKKVEKTATKSREPPKKIKTISETRRPGLLRFHHPKWLATVHQS